MIVCLSRKQEALSQSLPTASNGLFVVVVSKSAVGSRQCFIRLAKTSFSKGFRFFGANSWCWRVCRKCADGVFARDEKKQACAGVFLGFPFELTDFSDSPRKVEEEIETRT